MPVRKNPFPKQLPRIGSLVSLALLLSVSPERLTAGGLAPDANAIVKKMVASYKKAASVQDFAEATIIMPGTRMYIQSSRFKWKAPNLIYFQAQDPSSGTLTMHSNGSTVTLYSGKQNIFTRRNTSSKLQDTMAIADRASEDSFGVKITQLLSPLSFLACDGMPREARTFRYAGTTTLDGQRVHKVTALAELNWTKNIVPDATIVPIKRDISLWIDVKTNLLKKASGHFTWKIVAVNKTPLDKPQMGGFRFEETHRDTILNAPIPDQEFHFVVPKGAKQLFQEKR